MTKSNVDGNIIVETRCQSEVILQRDVHSAEVPTDFTMDDLASLDNDYKLSLTEIQQLKAETSQRC